MKKKIVDITFTFIINHWFVELSTFDFLTLPTTYFREVKFRRD